MLLGIISILAIFKKSPMEHNNKTFEKIIYKDRHLKGKEFNECIFIECDFSDSSFLSTKFLDCIFKDCNLSLMSLGGSTVNNAQFSGSKILGVNFSECIDFLFSVSFDNCILDYSSFQGKKMNKTIFNDSSLKGVNFTQTDLSTSAFNNCSLESAIFNQSNLSSVDLINAHNFSIDPELNRLNKAKFSLQSLPNLLEKYNIKVVY